MPEAVRSYLTTVDAGDCPAITLLGGVLGLAPREKPSRILDDLTLAGDGGGMDFGVDASGEACAGLSSLLPSRDEMDMPPVDLFDASDARSRAPAKGEAVGGPRGAEEALEGRWGGEGGGMRRDAKGKFGRYDSDIPSTDISNDLN